LVAARTASKDVVVRRQLESTNSFLQILSVAHARSRPEGVGIGEQLAAITLAADFAVAHPWLNDAAIAGLEEIHNFE
jgi:hypothetical protein